MIKVKISILNELTDYNTSTKCYYIIKPIKFLIWIIQFVNKVKANICDNGLG